MRRDRSIKTPRFRRLVLIQFGGSDRALRFFERADERPHVSDNGHIVHGHEDVMNIAASDALVHTKIDIQTGRRLPLEPEQGVPFYRVDGLAVVQRGDQG